jgi:hypothetical protein
LIVPVEDLSHGLEWGARLRRICLSASALLLCRDSMVAALHGASAPYTLIYTVEGLPEDVEAELAEAQGALRAAHAPPATQLDMPTGSDVWASWLGAHDTALTLRLGLASKDLPGMLQSLAADSGQNLSFVADLASGLLYARGLHDLAAAQRAAQGIGGYALALPAAGARDAWGHAPESLELMRAMRERWGGGGLLNPGAFVV